MPAASSRHPSSSTAVATDATMTKLTATPAEVALRASIPTTMVHNQTTTPVGTTAVGRRHARAASHPIAVPIRNGAAVALVFVSVGMNPRFTRSLLS